MPNCDFSGHKTPGKYMDEIRVGDYSGDTYTSTGWIYVVLSRVHALAKDFDVKPLFTKLEKYIQRAQIQRENMRLEEIAQDTKRKATISRIYLTNRGYSHIQHIFILI